MGIRAADEAAAGAVCSTKHAWARVPPEPSQAERAALKDKIRRLLKKKNAVMVSHYYVHPDLQDLPRRRAASSAIRWRWPALAATTQRRPWW